jgi:hypothetical protein
MTLLAPAEESPAASVDVVACLESAIAASANVLRYHGRLVCNFRPVGKVVADSGQLTQVFVNLLMNAAQALREDRAAQNEIRVSTRSEGSETVIEIHDNGEGIPESLIGRIFEPFFTTKEVGALPSRVASEREVGSSFDFRRGTRIPLHRAPPLPTALTASWFSSQPRMDLVRSDGPQKKNRESRGYLVQEVAGPGPPRSDEISYTCA